MPSIARARAASPQPPKLNLHLFSPAARPPSSLTDRIAYRPETKSGSHTTLRLRGMDSNFRYRGRRPASARSLRAQRVETDAAKREFGSDSCLFSPPWGGSGGLGGGLCFPF